MSIEDIKGYKPHTEDKISRVNAIKDLEVRLGALYTELEDELKNSKYISDEILDEEITALTHLSIAKERLKESSMWACRAVFRPEEKY